MDTEYFGDKPSDEIGKYLVDRVDDYYHYLTRSRYIEVLRRLYEAYYHGLFSGGMLNAKGDQGELTKLVVNHFRNILQHIVNMTTSKRLTYTPRAVNSDYKSHAQTILAKSLLDYYSRQENLEKVNAQVAEFAVLFGEGFSVDEWDATIGEDVTVDQETGEMVKNGDIVFSSFSPIDVIRDITERRFENCDWVITRRFVNKYDLAAKYTEHKEEIESSTYTKELGRDLFRSRLIAEQDTEKIPLYTFYHKKNSVLPEGRRVEFIDKGIALMDGGLPTDEFPVKRMAYADMEETPFGYSVSFDLLPVQMGSNVLDGTIMSNQKAFGVQSVVVSKTSNVDVKALSGMKFIQINEGSMPPTPLNLTQTPQEIFAHRQNLKADMETLSAVNSVVRGDPQKSLKSGSALALVESMATQFNNRFEQSYIRHAETQGMSIIIQLQAFAQSPRIATIVGKSNRSYLREFVSDDIAQIKRVVVEIGNPLANTVAGKLEMATNLLQQGLISNTSEYMQIMKTGDIDPMLESEVAEIELVRDENEKLAEGDFENVNVIATDSHSMHIKEHKVILSSTAAREDPERVEATLSHIKAHIQALYETPPEILMMIGEQSLQAPPEVDEQGNPIEGGGSTADVMGVDNAAQEEPEMPDMPDMPVPPQA
jgi:hypothetical protein